MSMNSQTRQSITENWILVKKKQAKEKSLTLNKMLSMRVNF